MRLLDTEPAPSRRADAELRCYRLPAGIIFTILAILLARNWGNLSTSCERLTDYVLLSLNVENAKDFLAWTGAYSRLELRHPGPVLFYFYALGDWLFSFVEMPLGRFRLTQFIINVLFLFVLLLGTVRTTRSRAMGIVAGICGLLLCVNSSGSAFGVLAEVWNPFPAILPMAALIVTGGLVMAGHSAVLPVATVSAVVAAHTHLGALPVAGTLYLLIIATWAVEIYRGRITTWRLSAVISGAIGLVTSIPMLVDACVSPQGGNLGAIVRFAGASRNVQSPAAVLEALGQHYTKLVGIDATWLHIITPIVLFVVLWIPRRVSTEVAATRILATIAYGMSVYSVLKTTGPLYPYLFIYHFGIALVVWTLAIDRCREWTQMILPHSARWRRGISASAVIAVTVALLPQLVKKAPAIRDCPTLGAARSFARGIPRVRNELNQLVTANESLWHSLAALALVLKREGREVCVDRPLWYVFDSSLVCVPQESSSQVRAPRVRVITMFDPKQRGAPEGAKSVLLRNLGIYWMPIQRPSHEVTGGVRSNGRAPPEQRVFSERHP